MFDIILIGFLSYRNGLRAKLKGENSMLWGILTVVAYLIMMMVGLFFVIVNFCKDTLDLTKFSTLDQKTQEAARDQLMSVFAAHPLHMITIELFGIGGYLMIRYILDRKPDKKEPEVHWMDKLSQRED